jgi:hypothetical protein
VQNYYNTAVEGLEELNALLPALEAYTADSSVVDLIKSAREQATKAEALVPAAKRKCHRCCCSLLTSLSLSLSTPTHTFISRSRPSHSQVRIAAAEGEGVGDV